ncbi:MAG: hypothetical protein HYV33_02290 [Candidatus Kerfeldbacteria bacterium]|nr:hypothetical protein [Candidatus Kerfeldbacteria bacterium]
MNILRRLSPYWSTALIIGCFWLGQHNPEAWPWVLTGFVATTALVVWCLHQPHWRSEYVALGCSPLLVVVSGYSFILIQELPWLIISLIAVISLFYFIYVKHLAVYVGDPAHYVPYSLEHISTYSNVVASFFFYVSIFMFFILQVSRLRYMMLMALVVTAVIVWQTFWIQKITGRAARWFIIAITLVITETVWVVHFWPVSFFVSGFLLTLVLYVLLHLCRHHLTTTLTRTIIWRYLGIGGLAAVLLLLTARWT